MQGLAVPGNDCGTLDAAEMSTGIDTAIRIHFTEQVHLAALLSTVRWSRACVRQICASWKLAGQADAAEMLASELVSNAVTASGVSGLLPVDGAAVQLIGLRLLALDDSLVIEVRDASPLPPRLMCPERFAEHGRGLHVVNELCIRWGYYGVGGTGKVVWCQLAFSSNQRCATDNAEFAIVQTALQAQPWHELA